MKIRRIIATVSALACVALFISACNTVEGAGKDIEKGGEAIQKAAD